MATKTTRSKTTKKSSPVENGTAVAEVSEVVENTNGTTETKVKESAKANDSGETLNLADLKDMSISELTGIAKGLEIEGATGMRKQELIFKVLAAQTEKSGLIFSEG
ncbi:MAG TPA: Rho termination factor N-terminal domain-containing protein, partial [Pyrinomonadaceae bacterium]|nr:Rho termination factor N-terminal domain-containing protein [Pyrinomonadaceae bacterium]